MGRKAIEIDTKLTLLRRAFKLLIDCDLNVERALEVVREANPTQIDRNGIKVKKNRLLSYTEEWELVQTLKFLSSMSFADLRKYVNQNE